MPKKGFLVGLIVGIVIGIILTIGLQIGEMFYRVRFDKELNEHAFLLLKGKLDIERMLSGARVLRVHVSPNSNAIVNYDYDSLYDVEIIYERGGKVKKLVVPYGVCKGVTICPTSNQLVIQDQQAEVINEKAPPDSAK